MQHYIPRNRQRQSAVSDEQPDATLDAILRASLERAV